MFLAQGLIVSESTQVTGHLSGESEIPVVRLSADGFGDLTIQASKRDVEFFDRLAEQAAHVASLIRVANAAKSTVGARA